MAIYAVGDIHGQLDALKELIKKLDLQSTDRIIFLGDYIDRGPSGIGVIMCINELKSICQVTVLLGNHDLMMLDTIDLLSSKKKARKAERSWYMNHGRPTHDNYKQLTIIQQLLVLDFLKDLKPDISVVVTGHKYVLCHSIPSNLCNAIEDAVWARFQEVDEGIVCTHGINAEKLVEEYSDKTIIHGHTPVATLFVAGHHNGDKLTPVRYELCGASFIDIDLCAGAIGTLEGANLCALRLDDQKMFYAN